MTLYVKVTLKNSIHTKPRFSDWQLQKFAYDEPSDEHLVFFLEVVIVFGNWQRELIL